MTGLTNGTELHVPRHARRTRSATSPQSAASRAVTPQTTIFDFATPATLDAGDSVAASSSASSSGPTSTARSPACASTRRRPTPARTSAACGPTGGTRLATATFTDETASGWQSVDVRPARSTVTAGTTYVASYFTPQRPLLGHAATASRPRSTTRRCTRSPTASSPQRRVRLRRHERRSRRSSLQRDATTGSTCCSRPTPRPGRSTGVTPTAGPTLGDGRLDRARERRPRDLLRGHAVHRRRRRRRPRRSRLAAGDHHDGHRPHRRAPRTRSRVRGVERQRLRARCRPPRTP